MRLYKYLLAILFIVYSFALSAQTKTMPIMAYRGVPVEESSDARFKEFADCGFNLSLAYYSNAEQFNKAATSANKYGVKILFQSPRLFEDAVTIVNKIKNNSALYGYFIKDEPSKDKLTEFASCIKKIKQADSVHPCYINLLPCYNETMLRENIKAASYSEYLREASSTGVSQISFDYYAIRTPGMRDSWYENLEQVRNESLRSGLPFWGFALSTAHVKYPIPTIAMLRLQVYSNLAYGAQGIEYFTYWTPKPDNNYDFNNGPIDINGKKTATYYVVKEMNAELSRVAPLFYGSKIISVYHTGNIPTGCSKMTNLPTNIKSLNITGGIGAIVSTMVHDSHRYLVIVNKDYKNRISVKISANSSVKRVLKNLKTTSIKAGYAVTGGDVIIFKLN